jgi:hypothetical protein
MPSETFESRQEMDRRAQSLQEQGDRVLVDDDPDSGVLGYNVLAIAGRESTKLRHYLFGFGLTPTVQVAESVEEFLTWIQRHEKHFRIRSNASRERQIGIVCFCEAFQRRSLVFRLAVEKTRQAPPGALAELVRLTSV